VSVEFRVLVESTPAASLVLAHDRFTILAVTDAYIRATSTTRPQLPTSAAPMARVRGALLESHQHACSTSPAGCATWTNALKYGRRGGQVCVSTRLADGWVVLAVHNEGPPIAAARLQAIFEPLQRGIEDLENSPRNTGMDLYIVKHIVESYGGKLALGSTAADGTTFTVHLPRAAAAGDRRDPMARLEACRAVTS
jgi:nitrogen-specific signal transduction histidine kinase